MTRDRVRLTLKIGLGFLLVFYVLRSRMVDFASLEDILFKPGNLLISLLLLSGMALCCASRWYFLTKAQGLDFPLKTIISLTMIGNFFNTFMPGSVGGDVVKAWYVAGREPKRRTKAIFTVLIDRVIGMSMIIFYASFTLMIFNGWVDRYDSLKALAYTVWAFTGVTILFGMLFFLSQQYKIRAIKRVFDFLRKYGPLEKIIEALLMYRHQPKEIVKAVCLSAMNVLLLVTLFSINGFALGVDLGLSGYFFVVPIGMTLSAIPLLPGGIGVGQVAFFTLFKWAGVSNPEQGSTLCTLVQIYVILFNCIGAIFYFRFKRHANLDIGERPIPDPDPKPIKATFAKNEA